GFGMGLERLLMVMENGGAYQGEEERSLLYVASLGQEAQAYAMKIVTQLRREGVSADCDLMDKSLKAQMKYADKMKYKYVCVLGEDEIKNGIVTVKDMFEKTTTEVKISDLTKFFRQ
ncbi:MAG: His/Gly/Thr/Pro-type tRNA ligase C-terminal domain-containing protein, partial [Christensenellales bacterium]